MTVYIERPPGFPPVWSCRELLPGRVKNTAKSDARLLDVFGGKQQVIKGLHLDPSEVISVR